MSIIRDEQQLSLWATALCIDWGVLRCNVVGCRERPNTIVTDGIPGKLRIGLCEAHYQQVIVPGGTTFDFEWDKFDAFEKQVSP